MNLLVYKYQEYIHTYVRTYVRPSVRASIHACTHACIHTYIQTDRQTYIHTVHTCIWLYIIYIIFFCTCIYIYTRISTDNFPLPRLISRGIQRVEMYMQAWTKIPRTIHIQWFDCTGCRKVSKHTHIRANTHAYLEASAYMQTNMYSRKLGYTVIQWYTRTIRTQIKMQMGTAPVSGYTWNVLAHVLAYPSWIYNPMCNKCRNCMAQIAGKAS